MKELRGQSYFRTVYEFVEAAELPEDAQFANVLFLKGDFVVKYRDGTQMPMKREKFLNNFNKVKEAIIVDDTITSNKRIQKSKQNDISKEV